MTILTMVGRRCTRCKGGIYTAWRTPDQQKFYHPHCFTCAICDVILDSVKECGVPNLQEIYCQDCHIRYFSDNNARRHNNSRQTSVTIGEQEILKALARTTTPRSLPISPPKRLRERLNTSEASSSGRIPGNLKFQPDDASQTLEQAKDGMINVSENYQIKAMRYAKCLERKTSRIPRPTSAISKKSLAKDTSAASSLSRSRTKVTVVSQNLTAVDRKILQPAKHKMHRSMSLVQPHEETSQNRETRVYTSAGNSKSSTHCSGAASRPVSARSEQTNNLMYDCVPFSKRQCAASFFVSNHHDLNKNVQMDQNQSNRSSKSRLTTGISYPKDETIFKIPLQDSLPIPIKSPLPTTKDILNVIKRGNSDLITLRSANNQTCIRNNRTTSTCKRSFKLTFDCPICISSLVQGNTVSGPLREGQRSGNVVTICGHLFHRDCMENWLKIKGHKRCPICSAFCLPETLQSVYMECNVSADVDDKDNGNSSESAYIALRHEYDLLKAKYDEVLEENRECELKAAIVGSLQSAYDMECRNRLQLQWDNKKLMRRIEEMQNSASLI